MNTCAHARARARVCPGSGGGEGRADRNVITGIRSIDSATSFHTKDYSFVEPVRIFMALFKEPISGVLLASFHRRI